MIIAFEGLDASGKTTQSKKLAEYLLFAGYTCSWLSFPDYKTSIGREIQESLVSQTNLSRPEQQIYLQWLFHQNRMHRLPTLQSGEKPGTHVVCDRYWLSSVYGAAAADLSGIELFRSWSAQLPKPDCWVFLDIQPEVAEARRSVRDGFRPKNLNFLSEVRDRYISEGVDLENFILMDGSGDPEEIHTKIVQEVNERIALRLMVDVTLNTRL